jgi:hypothetical protein
VADHDIEGLITALTPSVAREAPQPTASGPAQRANRRCGIAQYAPALLADPFDRGRNSMREKTHSSSRFNRIAPVPPSSEK